MNWYLIVKFLHILAVTLTIGGMFARQLIRGLARKSNEIQTVSALTQAAVRLDRALVIPGSNIMILMGIALAVIQKWPIFGFLQGASQNWLLASNILLVVMIVLIPTTFIPHNKKVEALLIAAIAENRVTSELAATLNDTMNKQAHILEEVIVIIVAALMVLKPF
jgi:uncharacterized membrane protein